MPRRASSSANPIWVVVVAVLLLLAVIGGWGLYKRVSDPYRTLTTLDVATYLNNANSLRGNVYKLQGVVGTQLAWAPLIGRLYSVETADKAEVLPLMIPAAFNSVNMQKGQRYFFKIEVGDKGILRVQDIRKV